MISVKKNEKRNEEITIVWVKINNINIQYHLSKWQSQIFGYENFAIVPQYSILL